jgi:hypothetical protein
MRHTELRFSFVLCLVFAACAAETRRGGPDGGGSPLDLAGGPPPDFAVDPSSTFSAMCSGTPTVLTGKITAPNGADPIVGASAYVPLATAPFPPGVACDLCATPIDTIAVSVTTGPDGTFSLDISSLPAASQISFTVSKGRFRRNTMVAVTACQSNALTAPNTVLPSKTGTGDDIPKIAVSTGNKDQLDIVLAAMGLDTTAGFDCYEGRKTTTTTLTSPCGSRTGLMAIETMLADSTQLANYNLVFLSCAPGKFASLPSATQTTIASNLKDWAAKGGRLFVTDNSYEYLAQAFPAAVTFMNASTLDGANVGVGSSSAPAQYTGRVNNTTLLAWLVSMGVVASGTTTLALTGYLNDWSVVQSVPMGTVDVVDATDAVAYTTVGGTTKGSPTTYPQSVEFDVNDATGNACGRAIYTSYHTLPGATAASLAPQERILEYLMFEAGSCAAPIM